MSNKSNYKTKRHNKRKKHRKKKQDPIELCAEFAENFLTKAYKLKVLKLKLGEDPLQRRIHFITFMESMEIMFSQYKETCEVIIDDQTIGWEDIKDCFGKAIMNCLHSNIDFNSRRLISELPVYGVK